jgi:hypothetical protein
MSGVAFGLNGCDSVRTAIWPRDLQIWESLKLETCDRREVRPSSFVELYSGHDTLSSTRVSVIEGEVSAINKVRNVTKDSLPKTVDWC